MICPSPCDDSDADFCYSCFASVVFFAFLYVYIFCTSCIINRYDTVGSYVPDNDKHVSNFDKKVVLDEKQFGLL